MENIGAFNYSRAVYQKDGSVLFYVEGAFNSAETKPTGDSAKDIASGSIITETDTGKVYFYDRYIDDWVKQFSFKG